MIFFYIYSKWGGFKYFKVVREKFNLWILKTFCDIVYEHIE